MLPQIIYFLYAVVPHKSSDLSASIGNRTPGAEPSEKGGQSRIENLQIPCNLDGLLCHQNSRNDLKGKRTNKMHGAVVQTSRSSA